MRRSLRWLSLLISINLVTPTTVFAQQPKKPKTIREELPTADAKKDWDHGMVLVGEKNWRAATIQFQRVYDVSKNPRVLNNLAVSLKEDRRYAHAIRAYEKELAEGAGVLTAQDVKEIKDAIQALLPFVSKLELTVNEGGAAVFLDDEAVGPTPLAPLVVSTGSHTLRVSKDGFREQTKAFEVIASKPSQIKLDLVAEKLMTLVTITAQGAPRANIRINGTEMGPSPYKGQIEIGQRYTVSAYAPNYVTAEQSLEVNKQEPINMVLTLSEQRAEGRVAVIGRPAGSIIEIDQKVVGSDKWEGVLSTGGHTVRIHKDGYVDHVQEIGVANDQTRTVEATLRQDTSRGAVIWAVGAAIIVIGGSVAAYAIASRGRDGQPVNGTISNPESGIMQTAWRFR